MQHNFNNQIFRKIKLSINGALIFGFVSGCLKALYFIINDSYVKYELQLFGFYLLKYNINFILLWILPASLIFAIIWIYFDSFEGLAISSLLVFAITIPFGFIINRKLLPGIMEIESILGNVIILLVAFCLVLILYKRLTKNLKLLNKIYSPFAFSTVILVWVLINLFYYSKPAYDRLEPAPQMFGKEFLSLFESSKNEVIENSTNESHEAKNVSEFLKRFQDNAELVRNEYLLKIEESYSSQDEVTILADAILDRKITFWGVEKKLDKTFDWYKNPTNDKVWLFALNELGWIKRICEAYVLTNDEKYARDYSRIMESWFEQISTIKWKDEQNPVWRLIGTGLRLSEAFISSFYIFLNSESVSANLKIKILSTIHDHAQFLSHFRSPRRNHLIQETYGLFKAATLFPEFKMANRWLKVVNQRFDFAFNKDVYPDGGYSEASTFYHYYVVLLMHRIFKFADFYDISLKKEWQNKFEKMHEFLLHISRPDGQFPQINDGFHGKELRRLFKFPGIKFDREDFKYYASNRKYGKTPEIKSIALPYTGLYVMRTSWEEDANYSIFDGGLFGSAHGHEDMLNFEIFALGKSFIVDPGTFTYVYNSWHKYFESSFSHNTIVVDGKSQLRYFDKSNWVTDPHTELPNKWVSTQNYDFVEATYRDGYGLIKEKVDKSVHHTRRFLFIKPDYWILWDVLEGKGEHKFEQLFHFMPMPLEIIENQSILTQNENEANLLVYPLNEDELSVIKIVGSQNPIQGWYASNYGKKEPAPAIIYSKTTNLPTEFFNIIMPLRPGQKGELIQISSGSVILEDKFTENQEAVAVSISTPDWTDYLIIAPGVRGKKRFNQFETEKELYFIRLDNNGKILRQFDGILTK